jgi:hypothetical protein
MPQESDFACKSRQIEWHHHPWALRPSGQPAAIGVNSDAVTHATLNRPKKGCFTMNSSAPSGSIPPSDDAINHWLKIAETASMENKITAGALENIRHWLTQPRYQAYRAILGEHLEGARWRELDDAFWTIIPFGTGGRRGRMNPI